MTPHTPTPWRIGDAGHTIFGPPNGKPCPEIVASLSHAPLSTHARANAAHIVHCVNTYDALVEALREAHNVIALYVKQSGFISNIMLPSQTVDTVNQIEQALHLAQHRG